MNPNLARKVQSIPTANPKLTSWNNSNNSSWAEFPFETNLSAHPPHPPSFLHAHSHHTDWPVICESPMVLLIIHDRPATDPQHSIWIRKWQAKHINGWQTGSAWPGAREELAHKGSPSFSQSQDWKYQCGTREALPSAQCMAPFETNVVLRRIVNLYTLFHELHKQAAVFKAKKNKKTKTYNHEGSMKTVYFEGKNWKCGVKIYYFHINSFLIISPRIFIKF